MLYDVKFYEDAKHLGLKSTTDFTAANTRLKDYFAITETSEELKKRVDFRRQKESKSIKFFARGINLIGHRAYFKAADPAMLKNIMIRLFVNGLNNEMSRERVILRAHKTLIEAAQFALFSESTVRLARNHSTSTETPRTVYSLVFRGSGSSSGSCWFASRRGGHSLTRNNNFRGRVRGRSSKSTNVQYRVTPVRQWPMFVKSQRQISRYIFFELSKIE